MLSLVLFYSKRKNFINSNTYNDEKQSPIHFRIISGLYADRL